MPNRRTPKKGNKYYIGHYEYFAMANLCLNYPEFEAELLELKARESMSDVDRARYASITMIMVTIMQGIHESAGDMKEYLFLNVCHGVTFTQLQRVHKAPLNHNQLSEMRTHLYYYLSRNLFGV